MWNYIKSLFRRKRVEKIETKRKRLNNVIYAKDDQSEDHIQEVLNEVFWKHHTVGRDIPQRRRGR